MNPAPARPEPARRRESARRHPRNNRLQPRQAYNRCTECDQCRQCECGRMCGSRVSRRQSGAAAGTSGRALPLAIGATPPTSYVYTLYRIRIPVWDSRIVAPSAIPASAGLVGWLSCGEPLIHCSNSLPLNTQPHLCDEEGSSARLLIGSLQAVANNVKGGRSVLSQMRRRAGETNKNHSRK